MSYQGNLINDQDVENWAIVATDSDKESIITMVEDIIKKITGISFYQDTFDIYMDGNNKNRIFLPLKSPILSIIAVKLYGSTLDTDYYAFDKHSVYIAEDAIIPELNILSQNQVLFPRDTNNIHITGTCGYATVPSAIKRSAIILVEDQNDDSLYTRYSSGSESIGPYSVNYQRKCYTGVLECDVILDHYISKKPLLFA